jgi:tRNA-binding EMAP/Myf-like protein
MSEFTVPIIKISKTEKHPNADSLSITEIEGNPVVFRTIDFKEGNYAVYIPIEAVVPLNLPCFSFLKDPNHPERDTARIKAKKLRGVFSMGLLVPIESLAMHLDHLEMGQDVAKDLRITKYEEPEPQASTPKIKVKQPRWHVVWHWLCHPVKMFQRTLRERASRKGSEDPGHMPVYDMESIRKYRNTIQPGEQVYVSEKIHGCNARFGWRKNRFYVGSHRCFKGRNTTDVWWKTAIQYSLEAKLKNFPGMVVYGEVYGKIQDLRYGTKGDEIKFAAFDVFDSEKNEWMNYIHFVNFCDILGIPRVPEVYVGVYNSDIVDLLASGKSIVPGANNIREGIVIKPVIERRDRNGRVILKLVSQEYLLRSSGTEFH